MTLILTLVSQVYKATLDEASYAKKKVNGDPKAVFWPHATFIAICSLRQVSTQINLQYAHALHRLCSSASHQVLLCADSALLLCVGAAQLLHCFAFTSLHYCPAQNETC